MHNAAGYLITIRGRSQLVHDDPSQGRRDASVAAQMLECAPNKKLRKGWTDFLTIQPPSLQLLKLLHHALSDRPHSCPFSVYVHRDREEHTA